ILNRASLNADNTNWNTAKACATNNNSSRPSAQSLLEGVLIKQTRQESLLVLLAGNKPSYIIRLLLRRAVEDVSVPGVYRREDGYRSIPFLGNIRKPLDNFLNTGKIV